ncbi:MAG: hypothetical protein ACJ8AT_02925 [Hyalangium sp.]|uniref:hypothetical protein n=1 Tax=Hyalangium sp. TaxID=2028555 RepID=UPI00389AC05E
MLNLPCWVSLLNVALCLLWSTLSFLVVRLGFQWAYTSWLRLRDSFDTGRIRTLAFVCAVVLFMGSAPRFVEVPLRLIYAAIIAVPLQTLGGAPAASRDSAPLTETAPPRALHVASQTLRLLASHMLHELQCFQEELPYVQLAFFCIVWFALARGFRAFSPPQSAAQADGRWSFQTLCLGSRQWSLLILLVVGLSLCVGSITSVCEMSDKDVAPIPELSQERLKARLEASQDGFTLESDPYPYVSSGDAGAALAEEVEQQQVQQEWHLNRAQPARPMPGKAQLDFVLGARSQLQATWKSLLELSNSRYHRATQDALTEYGVSSSTLHGLREQRQQFLDIVAWHGEACHALRTAVDQCRRQIIVSETGWAEWASTLGPQLEQAAPQPEVTHALRDLLIQAQEACQVASLKPVPKRGAFGEAIGPLMPIAGWLVQTESVQLALIIGMLGAGLLGSVVASFLRPQSARAQTERQLAGVVVRGLTAAIVVFLAIQGGLSTVSVSAGGAPPCPNPHLLLLICFVAAVYSEQVWTAAQQRLAKQLGTGESSNEAAPPSARPLVAAAAHPPAHGE